MTKGTPSKGKHNKTTHIRCRRCGNHSYHKGKSRCANCGFGATRKIRTFAWNTKTRLGKQTRVIKQQKLKRKRKAPRKSQRFEQRFK